MAVKGAITNARSASDLLLDGEDYGRWYADNLLDVELPRWWAQEPDGQDPTLRFASQEGMKGLLHSLLHQVGP
ncbi:hypothetical protein ACFV29_41590 [Streptomyces sp. NPDC059690]|uniref:hypothetical protein n=1 Tax=Streptomyces sp. NPDC059690 TaxID=3346907 RepID=UPI0036C3B798